MSKRHPLLSLRSVGPATLQDLLLLGIDTPGKLAAADPRILYDAFVPGRTWISVNTTSFAVPWPRPATRIYRKSKKTGPGGPAVAKPLRAETKGVPPVLRKFIRAPGRNRL